MSNPRYVPRELFPSQRQFGGRFERSAEHCGPAPSDPFQRSQWLAAQLQWEVASHVSRRLHQMGQTQRQLADTLGWRRERLSHMLKGRSVMALEDMFLLIGAIGGGWAEIAGAVGHGAAGVQAHELRQRRFYLEQLLEHNDAALAAAERNARSSYRSATTRQSSR